MKGATIKRFDAADEVRRFEKGRFERVTIAGTSLGRACYDPGWKWSVHVGPSAGTPTCQVEHVGIVVSGRVMVRMDDGEEITLSPGDVFHVGPGHDSWVVGNEPYVSLHLVGSELYARR
jgi:quercetin dioxygenase-like cupin family protein